MLDGRRPVRVRQTCSRADYLAFGDVREQVGRWWDLDRLEQLYQAFLDTAGPVLARWRGRRARAAGRPATARRAFADYVRALTAWRRLPFLDPGLPAELLPADWHGLRAARTFAALRARLAAPAQAYVVAVTGQPPPPDRPPGVRHNPMDRASSGTQPGESPIHRVVIA